MFIEYKCEQKEDEQKRWFKSEDMDLLIWYKDESIIGFQLSYDQNSSEHALTWTVSNGYLHNLVDSGNEDVTKNRTPILSPDGKFPRDRVREQFKDNCSNIDHGIVQLVLEKMESIKAELI